LEIYICCYCYMKLAETCCSRFARMGLTPFWLSCCVC
jgi:hypothetical protein